MTDRMMGRESASEGRSSFMDREQPVFEGIAEGLENGLTLPSSWYTDRDYYEL